MKTLEIKSIDTFNNFSKYLGSYYHNVDNNIKSTEDITIIDLDTKKLICILKKKIIQEEIYKNVVNEYLPIVKKFESSNRGFAAGMKSKDRIQKANFEKSNSVNSAIVGYIDSPNNKYPCRLTKFSRDYYDIYTNSIPFITIINNCFKNTLPLQYANQYKEADKTPYRISNTAFTTITVNYNFQTANHLDKGDYKEGFGILVVCKDNIEGGDIVFPRYNLSITPENGDILFMNVHEYHCNTNIRYLNNSSYRLSFVFYLRNRLLECKQNSILEEIGIEEGKHWNTSILIDKILEKIGSTRDSIVDDKIDPSDWRLEMERYTFYRRKRQYNFYDKIAKKRFQSLNTIWFYLKNSI